VPIVLNYHLESFSIERFENEVGVRWARSRRIWIRMGQVICLILLAGILGVLVVLWRRWVAGWMDGDY